MHHIVSYWTSKSFKNPIMISKIAVLLAVVAVTVAQQYGYGHRDVHAAPGYGVGHGVGHGVGLGLAHGYATPANHVVRPAYIAHAPAYKNNDYDESPKPYQFGYNIKDDYNTETYRQETGDDYGNVKGSYGYTDAYGIFRKVEYTADDYGFKAQIKTNEPGTANQNPADVEIYAEPAEVKYDAPKTGYKNTHAVVAHSASYQAPAYGHRASYGGAPAYGHRASYGVAPAYGHRASYGVAPAYGHRAAGYGHASHVTTHQTGYAAPAPHVAYAAAPVVHKASHSNVHRRGYDAHGNGYGHASHVSTHTVAHH